MKKTTKWLQDFFDEVEPILLKEPLASVLGAQADDEPFVINYADAVLLAGHSCPAVSGAYRLTQLALKALYGQDLPVRGEIRVLVKGSPEDLAYGPQAQVISFITGAWGRTGFKGLGGLYSRSNKLAFDPKDVRFNEFIFEREDTGAAVRALYNPGALPQSPEMGPLMGPVVRNLATREQKERFTALWQGNVRRILLESDRYPGLFKVEPVAGFVFPATSSTDNP